MTIWRMRIACWIPKTTNTHSECVILIAFPLQQWLHNSPHCYVIRTLYCIVVKSTEVDACSVRWLTARFISHQHRIVILWVVVKGSQNREGNTANTIRRLIKSYHKNLNIYYLSQFLYKAASALHRVIRSSLPLFIVLGTILRPSRTSIYRLYFGYQHHPLCLKAPKKKLTFFFLSHNLSIGWQLSICSCRKPFFPLLYNCQLQCFWSLALNTAVEVFPRRFFQISLLQECLPQTRYA